MSADLGLMVWLQLFRLISVRSGERSDLRIVETGLGVKTVGRESSMAYYLAEGAIVKGDVTIGEDSGIWYHATVRGDTDRITIGSRTNVQDNAVLHVGDGHALTIGNDVTIGHGAIVHGCEVGNNTLIGMGAIILNGAVIGDNCIIGAGALVTQNMEIPDGSLAFGNPAKIKRKLTEEEIASNRDNALLYVKEAKDQLMQM
jgi:carbonic anhydrase/acetyltransferase-like protein (isoleucine patch superfamily)